MNSYPIGKTLCEVFMAELKDAAVKPSTEKKMNITTLMETMDAKLRLAENTQKELEKQYAARLEQDAKRDVMYFTTPQLLLARAAWMSEMIGNIEAQKAKRMLLTELMEVATNNSGMQNALRGETVHDATRIKQ